MLSHSANPRTARIPSSVATKSFYRSLILSGISKATCNASLSRCANSCRAAVIVDHPFDFMMARKTNICCCQQPVPSNLGTAVLVNLHGPPASGPSDQARPNLRGPVDHEFIKVLTPFTPLGLNCRSDFFLYSHLLGQIRPLVMSSSSSSPRLFRRNAILVTGTKL